MPTVEVTKYTYHLFSSRTEDAVTLLLYDEKHDVAGEVFFVGDDDPLPPAAVAAGRVALYFRRALLPAVVDLLRNEGPVYLRWAGPINTCLSTEYEPVGEGEPMGRAATHS